MGATSTTSTVDPAVARAKARVGMVLQDKWRLDSLLGVGGMAAVYAATHRNNKRVAVKMLHPELCNDKEVRQRFLSEGYAANIIEHEGAVSVLDDDVAPDGAAFLVMELLDGETLEQRWERKGNRLDVREVLAFTDKLLDVLSAAHAKSIVHRDIKPENLFLTRSGTLKVLDFGIARVFEAQQKPSQTRAGTVMGTPAYMAPEQARARWDEVDGRTDLWAVGATMFTLLSGKFVHEAQTGNEQLIYSATTPARSIATVVTGLPRSVVATIDRALAFEKDKRWADAQSMQDAVRGSIEALEAQPGAATASGPRISMPSAREVTAGAVVSSPATQVDPSQIRQQVVSWAAERDARAAEIGKITPQIAGIQARLAAARRKVAEVQAKVELARQERTSTQEWFKRQVGTRAAAVEDARKNVRERLSELGRRALADRTTFGDTLDAPREEIARLTRALEARAHDVEVHEAALDAFDKRGRKLGIAVAASVVGAIVLFLLVATILRLTATPAAPPLPPMP